MLEPLTDTPAKERTFLDAFLESSMFAFPVVYIALVILEIAGIPAVSSLGGLVFYGAVIGGPLLLGLVAAMIRRRFRHR